MQRLVSINGVQINVKTCTTLGAGLLVLYK